MSPQYKAASSTSLSKPSSTPRKAKSIAAKTEISSFRKIYDTGAFPVCVKYEARGNKIKWKVDPATLDYHHYLPLFFSGLLETQDPYVFLVAQGIHDMITLGKDKVAAVIPQLILPIKKALNTKNPKTLVVVMQVMQDIVSTCPDVGLALVPYYKQLLPVFNQFKNRNVNLGDGIYYAQRKHENLGDIIEQTLQKLELAGGSDAFVNIKRMVPTYESAVFRH